MREYVEYQDVEERFWTKVQFHPMKCWEWKAYKDHHGYGKFRWKRFSWKAHRLSWTLANGPIPDGFFVLHNCDNPKCVRPSHLRLGDQNDNMQDVKKRHRHGRYMSPERTARGERNGANKLKAVEVLEIRELNPQTRAESAIVAEKYGVSYRAIEFIVQRKNWAWL